MKPLQSKWKLRCHHGAEKAGAVMAAAWMALPVAACRRPCSAATTLSPGPVHRAGPRPPPRPRVTANGCPRPQPVGPVRRQPPPAHPCQSLRALPSPLKATSGASPGCRRSPPKPPYINGSDSNPPVGRLFFVATALPKVEHGCAGRRIRLRWAGPLRADQSGSVHERRL